MVARFLTWLQPFVVRLYAHYGLFFAVDGGLPGNGATTEAVTAVSGGQPITPAPIAAPATLQEPKVNTTVGGGHAHHLHQKQALGAHSSHAFAFCVLLLLSAVPAFAQGGGSSSAIPPLGFNGAPTGKCGSLQLAVDYTTGNFYDCLVQTWNLVTGGGGGSGTVTNVATTSPIGGGPITTTGTITCSTCVVASAPGTGLAHFAGGTQTVTSSAVNLAADVTGQLPIAAVGSAGLSGTSPIAISAAGAISCGTCNISSATVSSVATTSPITGGTITSTGTIACGTCVVATTPGSGIAHFAGSTQTVTSSAVVSSDLNITTTTCSNQFLTAISATAVGTCTTDTLASAQHANQGTTTTVLHGNGSGNPAFGSVVGADMASSTVTATQLAAQYSKGQCTELWGGSGTSFALTSGDDAIANNACYNDTGVTRTITAVKCRSDNASNTTTVNPTFGSAGTGTTILSGALTCGNSYAYSSTGTISNSSWTTGTGINPVMAGTLTGTSIAMLVEFTF